MITADTLATLKGRLLEVLAAEGFRATLNEHGDIEFKSEGNLVYLDFDANDPGYLRMLYPHFWSIDDKEECRRAYVAANDTNLKCKAVKLSVWQDKSVWASVEFIIPSVDSVEAQALLRQIQMLNTGCREFAFNIQNGARERAIEIGADDHSCTVQ